MVSVYELKVLAKGALRLGLEIVLIVSNLCLWENISRHFSQVDARKAAPSKAKLISGEGEFPLLQKNFSLQMWELFDAVKLIRLLHP
jgi:hypothetical protein